MKPRYYNELSKLADDQRADLETLHSIGVSENDIARLKAADKVFRKYQ